MRSLCSANWRARYRPRSCTQLGVLLGILVAVPLWLPLRVAAAGQQRSLFSSRASQAPALLVTAAATGQPAADALDLPSAAATGQHTAGTGGLVTANATGQPTADAGGLPTTDATAQAPADAYGLPAAALTQLFEARRAALQAGQGEQADTLLSRCLQAHQRAGWPDVPALSTALEMESRHARGLGENKRALELAAAAVELAPHSVSALYSRAAALWAQGDKASSLATLWQAQTVLWLEPPARALWLAGLGLQAVFAAYGAVALLCLILLLRHGTAAVHSLSAHSATSRQARAVAALKVMLLVLPIALHCGPLVACCLLLCACGPQLTLAERRSAAIAVVLLCSGALCLPLLCTPLQFAGSPQEALYRVLRDPDAGDAAQMLTQETSETVVQAPATPAQRQLQAAMLYGLGLRSRWAGEGAQARTSLTRAAALGNSSVALQLALGNVRLLEGDMTGAQATYREVLQRQPNNVLAWFNLSQAQLANVEDDGDKTRRHANDLDFRQVAQLSQRAAYTHLPVVDPEPDAALVQATAPIAETLAAPATAPQAMPATAPQAELVTASPEETVQRVWRILGGVLPPSIAVPVGAASLVWLLYFCRRRRQAGRAAFVCERCGQTACPACGPVAAAAVVCTACTQAAATPASRAPGSAELRLNQEIQVHRHVARRLATQRLLAWTPCGGAQMLRGQPLRGLLLAWGFFTFLLMALWGTAILPELNPAYSPPFGPLNCLAAAVCLSLYIVAALDGRREEK